MNELRQCPFCGGDAGIGGDVGGAFVNCKRCLAATDHLSMAREPSDAAAMADWNRRADDWQPIETAPRDGTEVLVWADGRVDTAKWEADHHLDGGGVWMTVLCGVHPTHWRPLPEGPL